MASVDERRGYHHGALRESLLAAAAALIETEGVGAISLRRVARDAGVSTAAPYHHFADRSELLSAVAAQGYEQLAVTLHEAHKDALSPAAAVGAMVAAYAEFARTHRAYARLMFRPELTKTVAVADPVSQLIATVTAVVDRVAGDRGDESAAVMIATWSLAAGLAALWVDGPLEQLCQRLGLTDVQLDRLMQSLVTAWLGGDAR